MRVLIGCEFSQIVTQAFRDKGHEAYSCDVLPTEGNPEWHIKDDVLEHLGEGWDMMIAFPPCTHLAVSGARWFKYKRSDQLNAVSFFSKLLYSENIPKIAIENPVGIISTWLRKPDQIIQPWQFGHPESKTTCLWLKGLPNLKPTGIANFKRYRCKCGNVFDVTLGKYGCCDYPAKPLWDNQTKSGQNKLPPSEHRAKDRSKTYLGVAAAMADQWSL